MEDRKAAPALRGRFLRSYVPLRCVPNASVSSNTPSSLPGCVSSTHNFKFKREEKKTELYQLTQAVSRPAVLKQIYFLLLSKRLKLLALRVRLSKQSPKHLFKTINRNTVPYQPEKFRFISSCFVFGIVCERGRREGSVRCRRTHLRSGRRRSGAKSAENAL